MDEDVAARDAWMTLGEGAVSPASTTFRPGRASPSTRSGVTTASVGQRRRSPLQRAALGPDRNLQRVRGFDVEPTRP